MRGRPKTKAADRATKIVTLRFSDEDHAMLCALSKRLRVTQNEAIRRAIRQYAINDRGCEPLKADVMVTGEWCVKGVGLHER